MFKQFYDDIDRLRKLVSVLPKPIKPEIVWNTITYEGEEWYYITSTFSDAGGGTDEV